MAPNFTLPAVVERVEGSDDAIPVLCDQPFYLTGLSSGDSFLDISADLAEAIQVLLPDGGAYPAHDAGTPANNTRPFEPTYITGQRVVGSLPRQLVVTEAVAEVWAFYDDFNRTVVADTYETMGVSSGKDGTGGGIAWTGDCFVYNNKLRANDGSYQQRSAFANSGGSTWVDFTGTFVLGGERPAELYVAGSGTNSWVRISSKGEIYQLHGGSLGSVGTFAAPSAGQHTFRVTLESDQTLKFYVDDVLLTTKILGVDSNWAVPEDRPFVGVGVEYNSTVVEFENLGVRLLGSAAQVTPAVTKWAGEGTSLQVGYALEAALTNLSLTYQNFAVGGSSTASMTTRLTTNSAELALCDGAVFGTGAPNDLMSYGSDALALAAYTTYAAALKAKVNDGPVGIIGIPPLDEIPSRQNRSGFNARRRVVNAGLRAFCAANFGYFYCSAGEHPLTAYDNGVSGSGNVSGASLTADGGTGDYESDGLHPSPGSTTVTNETTAIQTALTAVIAQAGVVPSTTPGNFTWSDVGSSVPSTPQTSRVLVTGLGMGKEVTASVNSGPGTLSRGYLAASTSPIAVMAGDIVSATIVADATNDALLSSLYAIGGEYDTFGVTTQSATPPVITASSAVNQASSASSTKTFSGTATGAGRLIFVLAETGAFSVAPTSVTVKINAGSAQAATLCQADNSGSSVWISTQEAAASDTWEIVATWASSAINNVFYQVAYGTNMVGWTVKASSVLAFGSRVNGAPATPSTVAVAGGQIGIGFAFIQNGSVTGSQATINATNGGAANSQFVTTFTATIAPSFGSGSAGYSFVHGLAFGI